MLFLGILLGIAISIFLIIILNNMLKKKGKQLGLIDYKKCKNEE